MKGRWRRKCPCALAWAWLAAGRRARIFWAPPDTGFARDCITLARFYTTYVYDTSAIAMAVTMSGLGWQLRSRRDTAIKGLAL